MSDGNMREKMPRVAEAIDFLREVFGVEEVNAAIRRGLRGEQGFHAIENGIEIGTPIIRGVRIGKDERGRSINLDDPSENIWEPDPRRVGPVAWQAALDEQELENKKGKWDGTERGGF